MLSLSFLDIATNLLFVLSLISIFRISANDGLLDNISQANSLSVLLALILAFLLGFYPIPFGTGADREVYAMEYVYYLHNNPLENSSFFEGEWLFYGYIWVAGFFKDAQIWFFLTALIYVGNYWFALKRFLPNHTYLLFLAVVSSFGFISYGTNTIRAGLALSFVLVGLTYYQSLVKTLLFFFIAYNIHHSSIIPVAAVFIAKYYDRPKFFYYFWFFCVALSAVAGGFFTSLFSSMGQEFDGRVDYLTTNETHYKVGFRLDFVLYSCLPIIVGYVYQHRFEYQDQLYRILHNTYIIANGFWVLVVRANFSDRFAYLSWFLYALVMLYPLLDKPNQFPSVGRKFAMTLLLVSGFNYYMYIK